MSEGEEWGKTSTEGINSFLFDLRCVLTCRFFDKEQGHLKYLGELKRIIK